MQVVQPIKNTFTNAWNAIVETFSGMWNRLTETAERLARPVMNVINGIVDGVKSAVNWFKDLTGLSSQSEESFSRSTRGGYAEKSVRMNVQGFKIPELASGAVLRKPTLNLAGEYAGAASNPEIVSPQSLMQDTFTESLYPLTSTFHQDILFLAQVVRDSKIEISGDASDMLKLLQRSATAYQKRTGKPAF